jgi:hypothetical protein
MPALLLLIALALPASAGILISRTGQGLQFADASAVTFNSKDKALSLGAQPTLSAPISKLPTARLAAPILNGADAHVPALFESGRPEFLLPQGLPKTAPDSPAAIWATVRIAFKRTPQDKTPAELAAPAFVAYLPNGTSDLARLCADSAALEFLGGKGKGFAAQIELLAAAVKAYGSDPAMAPLSAYIAGAMRTRYEAIQSAATSLAPLDEAVRFAELSRAAYPDNAAHDALRRQIVERKTWLDRTAAILRAFAAAQQWDAFLLAERPFEPFEPAYSDLAKRHGEALLASLQFHQQTAARRRAEGDFTSAWRETRLAASRKPSDPRLREDLALSWTEYSRAAATDAFASRARLQPGQQSTVERYLFNAEQHRTSKNLDEALKSILDAESFLERSLTPGAVVPETLTLWFKKAEILGAQDRIADALHAIDTYDLHAIDDERPRAATLRNQILFHREQALKDLKSKAQTAWEQRAFWRALLAAQDALRIDPADTELQLLAGRCTLIARHPAEAREYFTLYLNATNSLDAQPEERTRVRRMLAAIPAAPPAAPPGEPDWLSGAPTPPGAFYSPLSLAFLPHVEHTETSNKIRTNYEWSGEKIASITPTAGTGEKRIAFAYRGATVDWATDAEERRPPAPSDPDDVWRRAVILYPNFPGVDPLAIESLTGTPVTVGIAGNRFFNPFFWDRVHYFRLSYDAAGRVIAARELTGPKSAPGDTLLEFEWNGNQLTAIRGTQNGNKIYERTLQYADGRLLSEEVQTAGKPAHIKYTYNGNRLAAAEAAADPTLDNRSRKIFFNAASPTTAVK